MVVKDKMTLMYCIGAFMTSFPCTMSAWPTYQSFSLALLPFVL
jgi:hypothetical protein